MTLAIAIVALLAAAGIRAGGFSIAHTPRADALRAAAAGRRGAATVAKLLDARADLQPAVNATHAALLVAAAVPGTWLVSQQLTGGALVAGLVGLVIGLWLVGDYLPRAVGIRRPATLGYRLAPLVRVALIAGNAAIRLVPSPVEEDTEVPEENEQEEEEERQLISSVLDFTETIVREVMVPRADMVSIDRHAGLADLAQLAAEHGFSRFPVTDGGEIVGLVLTKDVLGAYAAGQPVDEIDPFKREISFVPETKRVSDLLREMQATKTHLAVVVDEFGDIAGLVSIEDLLEELVGEIVDEHDEEEVWIRPDGSGSYLIDARLDVAELAEALDAELPDEDWDTVGGLVLGLAGRVPEEGEEFEVDGLILKVLRVQGRRIAEVEARRLTAGVAREADV